MVLFIILCLALLITGFYFGGGRPKPNGRVGLDPDDDV